MGTKTRFANYFEALGIPRDASDAEVARALEKQLRHYDRLSVILERMPIGSGLRDRLNRLRRVDESLIGEIREAAEFLSNPNNRDAYAAATSFSSMRDALETRRMGGRGRGPHPSDDDLPDPGTAPSLLMEAMKAKAETLLSPELPDPSRETTDAHSWTEKKQSDLYQWREGAKAFIHAWRERAKAESSASIEGLKERIDRHCETQQSGREYKERQALTASAYTHKQEADRLRRNYTNDTNGHYARLGSVYREQVDGIYTSYRAGLENAYAEYRDKVQATHRHYLQEAGMEIADQRRKTQRFFEEMQPDLDALSVREADERIGVYFAQLQHELQQAVRPIQRACAATHAQNARAFEATKAGIESDIANAKRQLEETFRSESASLQTRYKAEENRFAALKQIPSSPSSSMGRG